MNKIIFFNIPDPNVNVIYKVNTAKSIEDSMEILNPSDNIYNYMPSISPTFFSIIDALLMILPILIGVAFVTVAERKTMGSMQRRLGPNIVGAMGTLQAFADALKLKKSMPKLRRIRNFSSMSNKNLLIKLK